MMFVQVPDYYTLVKKPIDLATMENKCISEVYVNPQQFVDDFTLMLRNAEQYNEVCRLDLLCGVVS